ncbi:tyrosine-type recombinase/integrase [Streptomyces asiaticus]
MAPQPRQTPPCRLWTIRRQTTPTPGGLTDKHTKGRRARQVPIIPPLRPLVTRHLRAARDDPYARLFTGPRGGRITTAVLRDATHWNDVVAKLGYEHLRRHDLRHTGLTWMADAGIPLHVLQPIAGHHQITMAAYITALGGELTLRADFHDHVTQTIWPEQHSTES